MFKQTATILMLAIAALAFSGIASAQSNASAPTQQRQQMQQLVQKLRQKAAKLQQIHKETLKSNPDLQAQQKAFRQTVRQAIENQGYDIEAGRKHIEDMAKKLKKGNLSKEERKALMQEFAAERKSLTKARTAALQQSNVQKAAKQLQQATLAAMKAHSDKVEDLIQQMKQLRQKLRTLVQQQTPAK